MARNKIDPAVRKRAEDLLRQGQHPENVAKVTGLAESTLRMWARRVNPAQASSPASAGSTSRGPIKVEAVPVPPGGGQPPKGGGGYDAAKEAAGGPGAGASQGPKPAEAPQVDPVLALIMTSELALSVSCRFYALRLKVKWTPELDRFAKLTDSEKSTLLMYGPFVAPFLSEFLLKYGKYVGPAIYGLAFYGMVLGRFGTIKELAPPPEEKKPKEPQNPQTEAVGT